MSINNISNNCINKICFYLEDKDLKALGCVSKNIYKIAKKELGSRDQMYHELLSSYTATRRYNIKSYKEAKLFCLGEIHSNPKCKLTQRHFINFLASRGRTLIIYEGFPSLACPKEKSEAIKLGKLNPSYEKNLFFTGWDDFNELDKLFNAIDCEYKEKLEEYEKLKVSSFNEANQNPPLEENLNPSNDTWVVETWKLPYLDNMSSSERLKIATLNLERVTKRGEAINKVFPLRTASMITTLKTIRETPALSEMKIVLIAGTSHLETGLDRTQDENYSLFDLYEELKNHKSIVLLPLKSMYKTVKELTALQEKLNDCRNTN